MKFLAIFTLLSATASTFELPEGELKADNIVVPAGNPEGRISRGAKARLGQFPYMVGLLLETAKGGRSWCGGSLISNTKVLTAAHCLDGIQNATVYLDSICRQSGEITHAITSKNFIIHPGWHKQRILNDIAVVDLPYTAYSQNIQPVKIPSIHSSASNYDGVQAVATGWGRINDSSPKLATDLQFIYANVMSNQKCRSYYGSGVRDTNICIDTQGGVSTCMGDSGGPLVLEASNTQIAFNSFIFDYTCEIGMPAVFTRLTSYLDWIKDNAGVSY